MWMFLRCASVSTTLLAWGASDCGFGEQPVSGRAIANAESTKQNASVFLPHCEAMEGGAERDEVARGEGGKSKQNNRALVRMVVARQLCAMPPAAAEGLE